MSKKQSEKFDFDVLQKKEIERIDGIKGGLKYKQILCDGYIDTKKVFDNGNKILIIAAEASDPRIYDPSINISESYCGFFVKKAVLDNNLINTMTERKNIARKLMNNINRIYRNTLEYIIFNNLNCNVIDTSFETKDYRGLKEIAYVNMKKVGGHGEVNNPKTTKEDGCKFFEWVDYHKRIIALQINEISPRYVVLCGDDVKEAFDSILLKNELLKIHAKCFTSEHPLSRSTTEKFIGSFKFYKEI